MKIEPRLKVHACASPDPGRYTSNGVALRNGELCATNGRCLVRIPLNGQKEDHEVLPEETIVIPTDVFKVATGAKGGHIELLEGDKVRACAGLPGAKPWVQGSLLPEPEFPNIDAVTPDEDSRPVKVTFDAALLGCIVQALGTSVVTMHLSATGKERNTSPILVTPGPDGHQGARGVLMPIQVS